MPTRILIVEDNHTLRAELVSQLNSTALFTCVGNTSNGKDGVQLCLDLEPEVVLMDINLPDVSGVQCVADIIQQLPKTKIIMYTAYENSSEVFESLRNGASGYILKRKGFDELIDAIQDVQNGGAPLTPRIARKVVSSFQSSAPKSHEDLTAREYEILKLVANGLQNKQVAEQLNITAETVRVHLRNIYSKWQVRNRAEATARFLSA